MADSWIKFAATRFTDLIDSAGSYVGNGLKVVRVNSTATALEYFVPFVSRHKQGLRLAAAGGTGTFSITAGRASDTTGVSSMQLSSAYTKTTAAWAVGTGNGSLDTGAIAANTGYFVWEIQRPDTLVVDILISLSKTAPTMPASYTLKRRIGWMLTNGSSQWIAFYQPSDFVFRWVTGVYTGTGGPAGGDPGLAGTTYTLDRCPPLQVEAMLEWGALAGANTSMAITSTSENTAAGDGQYFVNAAIGLNIVQFPVWTNTSGQIRAIVSATGASCFTRTYGWMDPMED